MPCKQPKVAALILTKDRPRYLARALDCLAKQTTRASMHILVDADPSGYRKCIFEGSCGYVHAPGKTVGGMRNMGVEVAIRLGADVIIHWDDDDYSFPQRIERQLQQLKPVHAVGWRDLAFWDSVHQKSFRYYNGNPRYACGTSLCYRIEEWKNTPFPDLQVGEDAAWCAKVKPYGMVNSYEFLVAEIHDANTSSHVDPEAAEWTRTPSRDAHLAEVMAL